MTTRSPTFWKNFSRDREAYDHHHRILLQRMGEILLFFLLHFCLSFFLYTHRLKILTWVDVHVSQYIFGQSVWSWLSPMTEIHQWHWLFFRNIVIGKTPPVYNNNKIVQHNKISKVVEHANWHITPIISEKFVTQIHFTHFVVLQFHHTYFLLVCSWTPFAW